MEDHQRSPSSSSQQDGNQTPLPFASFSLSLFSPHLSSSSSPSSLLAPIPFRLKIPSQITSLSLALFHSPSFSSLSTPSKFSSSLSLSRFSLFRSRPADPLVAAGARRCAIVWFRADLRLHDHEVLSAANDDSLSLLPVFVFDSRDFGRSAGGFDRTGLRRARFLLDSVADLRAGLRRLGSDLVVRIGCPEVVLLELARGVGADAVYAHREVSHDEVRAEERVGKAMEDEGIEVKYFWGSTLHHIEDLPFQLEQLPTSYGGFREKVTGVKVRKAIEAPEKLNRMPSRGGVEPGEIPSLQDLGFNQAPTMSQDSKPCFSTPVGGETEALERLKKFASEWQAQPRKAKISNIDSIYGANFSCKISPWLSTGCLSPRFIFEELKSRTISAASSRNNSPDSADGGGNWLMFELLWRDFFRFVTMKCSSATKMVQAAPSSACTAALP
ncbi:blue-light photoreceptor PHR2-like [Zingiber officinale]|uniref:Photolyase/cryptochrome alpha/beta domain-containing protein n=1 Tax=Zingiber officinale TaxID=94328 RepID=A0A8J5I4U2_ZINOF|nr:blue-light photoreceptor PHR2-like [Zingiber officinale]XP_042432684.1 blue-light photoreceptor PHR2-like [Zingiber officinale]XP_042432686.1 blue-light photoreceptor PHR2-like [Zingiber officinale]KAG6535648.1 hypothetical protein ZIOFF_000671 [Zingiber officinale]